MPLEKNEKVKVFVFGDLVEYDGTSFYTWSYFCKNCSEKIVFLIPKGITTNEAISYQKCPNCECDL